MVLTETYSGPTYPFTKVYHNVRKKESRLYSDSEVARLPDVDPAHVHAGEWKLRKQSAQRLVKYLSKKARPLNILEAGCGNGWLSARLASLPGASVLGLDPHEPEIRQARRVFKNKRLQFSVGSFPQAIREDRFDIILFAASFQYFPDASQILGDAAQHLNPGGEIHIIDTAFYPPLAVVAAQDRSRRYFSGLGLPAMADHYFHHTLPGAEGLSVKMVFDPAGLVNRLFRPSPFPWICFSKTTRK